MSLVPVIHAYGLARSSGDASEDAYAVDARVGRVALADGASTAWRAGDWAATLAAAWVDAPPHDPDGTDRSAFVDWLTATQEAFTAEDLSDAQGEWFTQAAAERGAHAALLGLQLSDLDGERPQWRALAVGDVCVFHVRGEGLLAAVPLDDPAQFTSRPDLISSLPGALGAEPSIAQGELQEGDLLVLASDALAAFLLRLDAAGEPVWTLVRDLDRARFTTFVTAGHAAGLLERDDTTLVRVVLAEDEG